MKHLLSPAYRDDDAVILEGYRLIVDAIRAGFYPNIFAFSRLKCLRHIPFDLNRDHAMYQIPYTNITAWSDLKTPPGLMGERIIRTSKLELKFASLITATLVTPHL